MMETDLIVLHKKIDLLAEKVENQAQNQPSTHLSDNGNELALLHQKIDHLTDQMEAQKKRQEELDELKNDLIPVANHMIKLSIDELAEIGSEFRLEDLLFLIKRLLRDTHLLLEMLDRFESTMELADETQRLGTQVFHEAVVTLDRMEREGYFTFAKGGWKIVERIVKEFSEEDIEALGENIVTILTTVRNLTQPEIMSLTNNAVNTIRNEPLSGPPPSVWTLARELSDPQVRKGMVRLINLVKILAEQPNPSSN
jgi:uncharacterized protein YjgD (DUF1641 family)